MKIEWFVVVSAGEELLISFNLHTQLGERSLHGIVRNCVRLVMSLSSLSSPYIHARLFIIIWNLIDDKRGEKEGRASDVWCAWLGQKTVGWMLARLSDKHRTRGAQEREKKITNQPIAIQYRSNRREINWKFNTVSQTNHRWWSILTTDWVVKRE